MINEKQLEFFINFGSYKPKYLLTRIAIISAVATLLIVIVRLIAEEEEVMKLQIGRALFIAILAFNYVSELNLFFMKLFARSKWRWNLYIQIVSILIVSGISIFLWMFIAEKFLGEDNILKHPITQVVLIVGWLIVIIHLLVSIISNLVREWMQNRREIAELKQAKLLSDYNSLKDRLNPHFLFNNLSVLKSLIRYNQDSAETFTQNFTNVYRYLLKSHEEKTVALQEELKFVNSYIALHKERIGEALNVTIHIEDEALQKSVPPMSLQLLVENAIKHNIANAQNPLSIEIFSSNNQLVVKNNLNKKDSTYSTNTGLQNLKNQYLLIANEEVGIMENENYFSVSLPLI